MSSLVAVLTPFMVSLVLVLIFLAFSPAESKHPRATRHIRKIRRFSVLSIEQAFDPDYAIIWDTQVPALRLIASAGRTGLPVESLCSSYTRSCRRYPEIYDGSNFEGWLEFLEETKLITVRVGRASLTQLGEQFLRYRITAGHGAIVSDVAGQNGSYR